MAMPDCRERRVSAINPAALHRAFGRGDVKRIIKHGKAVCGVELSTGEELPAHVVIIGKGVTPNIQFLNDTGIAV